MFYVGGSLVCLKGVEVSYLSKSSWLLAQMWTIKRYHLMLGKVKQLDVHFSHILKAGQIPQNGK